MKKLLYVFLLLFFAGCGFTGGNAPVESKYAPNGIIIKYITTENLNFFDNEPHSIIFNIYQLNDKNMFNELCSNPDGRDVLLSGQMFGKSALGVVKKIIFPKSSGKIVLDKLQNTKYVGIVAGFYSMPKCMIVPLETKKVYFTSVKFWKPKIEYVGLNATFKLYSDNIQLIKDTDE